MEPAADGAPLRGLAALRRTASHWPALLAGIGVLAAGSAWLAAGWFAASRLSYVIFVGLSLRGRARRGAGRAAAWEAFSARASWLMDNDAVAFVALCLVTRDGLPPVIPWAATLAVGAVLVGVGIVVKAWATATLSAGSYHWKDFFLAPATRRLAEEGPYRWLSNPMYTVGYAHAYGAALALRSPAGLLAAAGAQASILLLHALVERPHVRRLRAGLGAPEGSPQPQR